MLTEFLTALQFLTIIRIKKELPFNEAVFGRSGVFFPVVGLLIGGVVWGLDVGLRAFFPETLVSVLLVAAFIVLSRGFHLDGLVDSVDGLFGSRDRQQCLTIMKDSTVGAFGVLALIIALFLKIRALDLLQGGYRGVALLLAPMMGRWACVVMAYSSRPARAEGLGASFVKGTQFREFSLSSVLTLGVVFTLVDVIGLVVLIPIASVIVGFILYCNSRLSGATGDTLGALGEMVETTVLCLFILFTPVVQPG